MEVFRAILQIYLVLIGINIVLVFALWRATRIQLFFGFLLHWCLLLVVFFLQRTLAPEEPYIRLLGLTVPNFFSHFTLVWVFANMAGVAVSWKRYFWLPVISMPSTYLLHLLKAPPEVIALPLVTTHAFLYFSVVFKVLREKRKSLSFSLKAISVVLVLYGLHLLDFAYFYTRFDQLAVGFTLAFILLMSFSILFPAAIIERITNENAKLAAEMEYKAKLTQSAKMAALGEMAGGVAHEINNPLAILSILGEQLRQRLGDSAGFSEIEPLLDKSQSTVERMASIVRALLTFSKEEPAKDFVEVSVQSLVQDTLALCLEKFKSHDIDFSVNLPQEELLIEAYPVQVTQVLLNLLNNAYDAVEGQSHKAIALTVLEKDPWVQFIVADNGPGVSKDLQDKIFQPFFTTKEVGSGTGLGLSISKGIIESHQGRIFLDSAAPGARFVIEVPKSQSH